METLISLRDKVRPMRGFFLLLLSILFLAGCATPFDGSALTGGQAAVRYVTEDASGSIVVRVDSTCHSLLGTINHAWNQSTYNPLTVVHIDGAGQVSKLYWGLEYYGAKELAAEGGVSASAGGTTANAPAILPGQTIDNVAAFASDAPAGWIVAMWTGMERGVDILLQSDCRGLKVVQVAEAEGFHLLTMEGTHVSTVGPLVAAKTWSSDTGSTFLMLRSTNSHGGAGTLSVSAQGETIHSRSLSVPGSSCPLCLEDERIAVLAQGPIDVGITYVGSARQTMLFGLACPLPFALDAPAVFELEPY